MIEILINQHFFLFQRLQRHLQELVRTDYNWLKS